jgi:hypothetical protein
MSNHMTDHKAVVELWRQRLRDAKLRVDFAHSFVLEVRRDFPSVNTKTSDGTYAWQRALRMEIEALADYRHVMGIYRKLILEGKAPEESEWRRHAPPRVGESGEEVN